jgi:hypothetical protein
MSFESYLHRTVQPFLDRYPADAQSGIHWRQQLIHLIIQADGAVVCRLSLLLNAQDPRTVLQTKTPAPDRRTVILTNADISIGLWLDISISI